MREKDKRVSFPFAEVKWRGCQHYRILSHRFSLYWNSPEGQKLVEDLYPCCRTEAVDSAEITYFVYRKGEISYLFRGRDLIASEIDPCWLFPCLEWRVTDDAMKGLGTFYQLHAGAVARYGRGILLPGQSGSGKTTLVTALCLNSFSPLSDDITMVDPDSCELVTFPRSFLVKEGTLQALPELKSLLRSADSLYWRESQRIWYLPREEMSAEGSTDRIRPGYLIFPRYSSGTKTELCEIGQIEALESLITKSFNFGQFKTRGIQLLSHLVRQVRSFRLIYQDIRDAVEAISSLP